MTLRLPLPDADATPASGPSKKEMLEQVSPRRVSPRSTPSSPTTSTGLGKSKTASAAVAVPGLSQSTIEKRKKFSLFRGKGGSDGGGNGAHEGAAAVPATPPTPPLTREKSVGAGKLDTAAAAPSSGAPSPSSSSLERRGSASLHGSRSSSALGGAPGYDALVFAQVVVGDEDDKSARPRLGRRGTKGGKESGESGDDADASVPLPLRRGQIFVVFELAALKARAPSMGFANGQTGRFDRARVKVLEGAAAPQCPPGAAVRDWTALTGALAADDFALLRMLLDTVGSANYSLMAAFLLEVLRLSDARVDVRALLRHLIRYEVEHTSEHQMLFRGNSVASRVLSQYAKAVGTPYLELLLRPLFRATLLAAHELSDFREAPTPNELAARKGAAKKPAAAAKGGARRGSRARGDDDDGSSGPVSGADDDGDDDGDGDGVSFMDFLRRNGDGDDTSDELPGETSSEEAARKELNDATAMHIWRSTELVMDALMVSFERIPFVLRRVAHDIYAIGSAKFADYHLVLAGFFVLRFIAPAIASPDSGLMTAAVTPEAKKRLLQVSKVVQAIANHQPFKESSHLDVLNDVVLRAGDELRAFFDKFKEEPAGAAAAPGGLEDAAQLDAATMQGFWQVCVRTLPALARRVEGMDAAMREMRAFAGLLDCLSGLPLSSAR